MTDAQPLAEPFEAHRTHLRAVAYRMLGSASEADDAVQEAWLRLHRSDTSTVDNLRGWLTTVVARVCLDMLRTRKSRREEALDTQAAEPVAEATRGADPEHEAVMADSVGLALLVVLDTLAPAERLAFVLHDMFAVPFEEIAAITGRSATAARQLASRARRRVRGGASGRPGPAAAPTGQRALVEAFLTALRAGDLEGLVAVLDPDVVVRVDAFAGAGGGPREVRGARTWAQGAVAYSRYARFVEAAVIDGAVGLVLAPRGKLQRMLRFTVAAGRITRVEIVGDPARLREARLTVLD